ARPGVTGPRPGATCREHWAGPAGIDWHWGLGPKHDARCADFIPPPPSPEPEARVQALDAGPGGLSGLPLMRFNAYWNPPGLSGMRIVNTRAWRAAVAPAANRHRKAGEDERLLHA